MKRLVRKTKKLRATTVNAGCNKTVDKDSSSLRGKEGEETINAAKVEKCRSAAVTDVGLNWRRTVTQALEQNTSTQAQSQTQNCLDAISE